jgi:sulfide:quinone oxidoreductase
MVTVTWITPRFAIAPELNADDFANLAKLGFKSILSNRPDGEEGATLTAKREAVLAWQAGLQFRHVPTSKLDVFTDSVVEGMADALADLQGPVLAHCKSGIRSAIVWAAASARTQPVDCVLDALSAAKLDLDFLRDDLEQQADRARWLGTSPALDCDCDLTSLSPSDTAVA